MKRDYLNVKEQMDLYSLLLGIEAIESIGNWEWLDGKTKGYLKGFHTRFIKNWEGFVLQLPKDSIKKMQSFTDGYAVEFKPKMKNPAQDLYKIRREDLEDLLELLVEEHCVGCQKTGKEVKDCKIRLHQSRLMHIKEKKKFKGACEYAE